MRRGIANPARSDLTRVGYLVSGSIGLAIVTLPRDGLSRRATYAGGLHQLAPSVLSDFTIRYRWALGVL